MEWKVYQKASCMYLGKIFPRCLKWGFRNKGLQYMELYNSLEIARAIQFKEREIMGEVGV